MSNNKYSEVRMLLTNYLTLGQYVDRPFVDRLIISSVKEDGLSDYVKRIEYDPERYKDNKSTIAEYNSFDKTVYVNSKVLYAMIKITRDLLENMSPGERVYCANLITAQYFLHEIVHADQHRRVDNINDTSFDTSLMRLSLYQAITVPTKDIDHESIGEKMFKQYKENYLFDFCERTAEINSFKTILSIISDFKMMLGNAYQFLQKELMSRYIIGYKEAFEKDMCPLEAYFYGTNRYDLWKGMYLYRNNENEMFKVVSAKYPLLDRCYYGLPISKDEYEDIKGRAGLK